MHPREHQGRAGRFWFLTAALGGVVLLSGVALHAVAAHYRPGGPQPLGTSVDRASFSWGWLRLAAWAAAVGGAWLLAVVWARRRGEAA